MEDLFGAVVIIIGIIASIISSAKKEKEKKAAMEKHKAAAVARLEAAQKQKAAAKPMTAPPIVDVPVAAAVPISSAVPLTVAAPTVHPHIETDCETHDQPGSLGVVSMEGKDLCHEDELTLERTFAEEVEPEGGLTFDWTGESMVKAVIMQEVLTRPVNRAAAFRRQAR